MADYKCFCGKPIVFKEKRFYTWCDWCGEKLFPEYLDYLGVVLKLENGGSVSDEEIHRVHFAYVKLAFDVDLLNRGIDLDLKFSRGLLLRAAKAKRSPKIWLEFLSNYETTSQEKVEYGKLGFSCGNSRDIELRKKCICYAAKGYEKITGSKYSAEVLDCYVNEFSIDPTNADLAYSLYANYRDGYFYTQNRSYINIADKYLKIAEQLGSVHAKRKIESDQSRREHMEWEQREKIRREAEAEVDLIQSALLAAHAHEIMSNDDGGY